MWYFVWPYQSFYLIVILFPFFFRPKKNIQHSFYAADLKNLWAIRNSSHSTFYILWDQVKLVECLCLHLKKKLFHQYFSRCKMFEVISCPEKRDRLKIRNVGEIWKKKYNVPKINKQTTALTLRNSCLDGVAIVNISVVVRVLISTQSKFNGITWNLP